MALFYSFLWLSSIPLCVCVHVYVCVCVCVCVCVYHIFFIHLSADGHKTGCFYVWLLWTVLLQTQGHVYLFELQLCSDMCSGVGLLNHTAILVSVFWASFVCVFKEAVFGIIYRMWRFFRLLNYFFFFIIYAYMCMLTQSCPTLSDPMDCSPSGFSGHRISQARILEWAAISFSRGSSWPRDQTRISCIFRIDG